MAPAAAGTLIATAVLVAILAVYLIAISINLKKISDALDTVLSASTAIANQVKPAPGVVTSIARDVDAIQGALHGLIALATAKPAPAAAAPAPAPEQAGAGATPAGPRVIRRTPPSIHAGRARR